MSIHSFLASLQDRVNVKVNQQHCCHLHSTAQPSLIIISVPQYVSPACPNSLSTFLSSSLLRRKLHWNIHFTDWIWEQQCDDHVYLFTMYEYGAYTLGSWGQVQFPSTRILKVCYWIPVHTFRRKVMCMRCSKCTTASDLSCDNILAINPS